MTSVAKQIGNAVPPLLAQAIALAVMKQVDANHRDDAAVRVAA